MDVEIDRLPADLWPKPAGTVIVRDLGEKRVEVWFVGRREVFVVYSSAGAGDDLRQAISWATDWAPRRGINKVYLDTRIDFREDDARRRQERLSRRIAQSG